MDAIRDFFAQLTDTQVATLEIFDLAFVLLVTFLLGLYMIMIYRKVFSNIAFSQSYLTTLIMVSLITTMVVLTIRSNIIVSLGMVGALSIVRFRTPLKEPLDLGFMFWAVGIGITMGALLYDIAIFFSIFIGTVILIISKFRNSTQVYMLIIEYNKKNMTSKAVDKELDKIKYVLRSKRVRDEHVEIILEVTQVQLEADVVNIISSIEGVISASIVGYNGEYLG